MILFRIFYLPQITTLTVENNKNKKSVKFQGDMLNFCDFIQIFAFTRNHHLKRCTVTLQKVVGSNLVIRYSVDAAVYRNLFFPIRVEQGSLRKEMSSAFHILCPRYGGLLTPTAPVTLGYGETFRPSKTV